MNVRNKALRWGIPLLVLFAVIRLLPFVCSVWYSLVDDAFRKGFAGLRNYRLMFENRYFLQALRNTAVFTVPAVAGILIIALLMVFLFRGYGKSTLGMNAFLMPMLMPTMAVVTLFRLLSGEDAGIDVFGIYGRMLPVWLLYLWKNTGFVFLILYSAAAMTEREQYEAASIDGAGKFTQFRYITLPSISGAVVFVAVYALMKAFGIFKEVFLLYGEHPMDGLYLLQHYMNNHFTKLQFPNVAAAGTVFALFCFLISAIGIRAEERISE